MIFGVSANACSLYPSHRGTWVMNSSTPLLPSFIFSLWEKKGRKKNIKKKIHFNTGNGNFFSPICSPLRKEVRGKNLEYISRMNVILVHSRKIGKRKMFFTLFLQIFSFSRFVKWRRLKDVKGKGNCHKSGGYLFLRITGGKREERISHLVKLLERFGIAEKGKLGTPRMGFGEIFNKFTSTFKRLENFS